MSAWLESHQSLRDHPKTKKLARLLGVRLPEAIGILHCLWWWCLDYAQDGDLTQYEPDEIADGCEWGGDPSELLACLVDCHFVDNGSGLIVHDWYEYAGKLMERRAKDSTRKKDMRDAYADGVIRAVRARDGDNCRYCGQAVNWKDRRGQAGATYDHIDPSEGTTTANLVVACRSCNSAKGDRSLAACGLTLRQVGPRTDLGQDQAVFSTDTTNTTNTTDKQTHQELMATSVADFEDFWTVYPRKLKKQTALRAWTARVKDKHLPAEMIAAARIYADHCRTSHTEPRYIMHAATFIGPDVPYLEWLHGIPAGAGSGDGSRSMSAADIFAAADSADFMEEAHETD